MTQQKEARPAAQTGPPAGSTSASIAEEEEEEEEEEREEERGDRGGENDFIDVKQLQHYLLRLQTELVSLLYFIHCFSHLTFKTLRLLTFRSSGSPEFHILVSLRYIYTE